MIKTKIKILNKYENKGHNFKQDLQIFKYNN